MEAYDHSHLHKKRETIATLRAELFEASDIIRSSASWVLGSVVASHPTATSREERFMVFRGAAGDDGRWLGRFSPRVVLRVRAAELQERAAENLHRALEAMDGEYGVLEKDPEAEGVSKNAW